jgi:hypothetical protein
MSKTIETVPDTKASSPVTAVTTAPVSATGATGVTTAPGAHSAGASVTNSRPVSWYLVQAIQGLASLRLTVVLFTLSLLLVFFGTLAQIDAGIWTVVKDYFRSFYVWIPLQLIVQFGQRFFPIFFSKTMVIPGALPFPGGWAIGLLLLINVLTAYGLRYRAWWKGIAVLEALLILDGLVLYVLDPPGVWLKVGLAVALVPPNLAVLFLFRTWTPWKRLGVLLLHNGLILMLAGEFITGLWAIEGNMVIEEGQTTNVVLHNRSVELAIVDSSSSKTEDHVTVVPASMLKKHANGGTITSNELPFQIEVVKWMVNSDIKDAADPESNPANTGFGKHNIAVEQPEVSGVASKQTIDMPSVYLKLKSNEGKDLGVYLLSTRLKEQTINVDGKLYEVALRFKHTYKPYSLTLEEFRFDRYVGTSTPKNFSSRVRLIDPERDEDREVTISMNNPMRHRGDALFQADWNKETEKGTVLQVVRNPAWQLPYWSCAVVALGMIMHFGLNLTTFLRRRSG